MKIFIGSSTESISYLEKIATIIEESSATPVPWNQTGLFPPGTYTLSRLQEIAYTEVDAAILIYSPDDKIWYRNGELRQPRDNVLFEHGLFTGTLGVKNAIMVKIDKTAKNATDLAGLTFIDFSRPSRAKEEIKKWIEKLIENKNSNSNKIKKPTLPNRNKLINEELICETGLKSFFPTRLHYPRFRDKVGSIDAYVNTAKSSVIMVSINLMTGLPFDGLCHLLDKRLREEKKENFKAKVSLLDPEETHLIKSISPVLDISSQNLSKQIKKTLEELCKFRKSLPYKVRKNFAVGVHKSIPFGSAIIIDHEKPYGKIQIETKPYKAPIQKSFAFEVIPTSKNSFFHTLVKGYLDLIKDGRVIKT